MISCSPQSSHLTVKNVLIFETREQDANLLLGLRSHSSKLEMLMFHSLC